MQKLFSDTRILDKASREKFSLTEELMMENAAAGLERHLIFPCDVVVLCGSGNNGADGYALARRICCASDKKCDVVVVAVKEPKSELCKLQAERAKKVGVKFENPEIFKDTLDNHSAASPDGRVLFVIDCIFGSGFRGELDSETAELLNCLSAQSICNPERSACHSERSTCHSERSRGILKIACDVPTGLRGDGTLAKNAFVADVTVTMGALKTCLYSDEAKDFTGEIFVEDLGIQRELFETSHQEEKPEAFLLEESDFMPPIRKNNNVNKGSFGHVAVFSGEKSGASVIAGLSALNFGAGLVTLISENKFDAFPELMASEKIPERTTTIVAGLGFGRENPKWKEIFKYIEENPKIAVVFDADVFYREEIVQILSLSKLQGGSAPSTGSGTRKIVLTPHPKEFQNLWKMCFGEELSVGEIVKNKIPLAKKFCEKYPDVVLVLKGANPIISSAVSTCSTVSTGSTTAVTVFVCPFGTPALAKAGSGDVLSGLIGALLAQGRDSLDAAKNGVLAHSLASTKFENNWELTPLKLVEKVDKMIANRSPQ